MQHIELQRWRAVCDDLLQVLIKMAAHYYIYMYTVLLIFKHLYLPSHKHTVYQQYKQYKHACERPK